VARKSAFLNAEFSEQWGKSYQKLQNEQQKGVDKAVMAIIKGEPTPGLRIKPIEPSKYYDEARVNDGDRVIHRISEGIVRFVDIVPHDDIGRYGKPTRK